MAKVRSQKRGSFVIAGLELRRDLLIEPGRYRTLAQAQRAMYGSSFHGPGSAIAHVVEDYQELEGDARPYLETPKTRIRRLVHSKLDPLYAKRKAWTTKLRRAETALRRLKRRIAWHERHLPG